MVSRPFPLHLQRGQDQGQPFSLADILQGTNLGARVLQTLALQPVNSMIKISKGYLIGHWENVGEDRFR